MASTNVVEVELSADSPQDSSESQYAEALNNLRTRKPVQRFTGDFHAEQVAAAKDYYANIRTNVSCPTSNDHSTRARLTASPLY